MGAHGFGPFDNDDAGDWLSELWESQGIGLLQSSLQLTLIDHIYLQAPKGAVLLAASEVVAEGCGVGSGSLPREARNWVLRHPRLPYRSLQPLALKALRRVLGGRSELNQLWREDRAMHGQWRQGVLGTRERLIALRN